jgi:hypothetical protein
MPAISLAPRRWSKANWRVIDELVAFLDLLHLNPGIRRPSPINIDKPCSNDKIKTEMGWNPNFTSDQSVADSVNGIKNL